MRVRSWLPVSFVGATVIAGSACGEREVDLGGGMLASPVVPAEAGPDARPSAAASGGAAGDMPFDMLVDANRPVGRCGQCRSVEFRPELIAPITDGGADAAAIVPLDPSCAYSMPSPSEGAIDLNLVNVVVTASSGSIVALFVEAAGACGDAMAWYYDDPTTPQAILLCPALCDATGGAVGISIDYGCLTRIDEQCPTFP